MLNEFELKLAVCRVSVSDHHSFFRSTAYGSLKATSSLALFVHQDFHGVFFTGEPSADLFVHGDCYGDIPNNQVGQSAN